MRCPPRFTTLGLALFLSAGAFSTIVSASEHDESSPSAEASMDSGGALSDAELETKYGIRAGAVKRDEPESEDERGGERQTQSDAGQASEQDNDQEAEQGSTEGQEGDSGDAVTEDTESEEVDEGSDQTEMEQRED